MNSVAKMMLAILLVACAITAGTAHAQITFRAAASASSASGPPAPTFQAAGTAVNGTGTVTPTWPAHVAGDVALLFIESAGGEAVGMTQDEFLARIKADAERYKRVVQKAGVKPG